MWSKMVFKVKLFGTRNGISMVNKEAVSGAIYWILCETTLVSEENKQKNFHVSLCSIRTRTSCTQVYEMGTKARDEVCNAESRLSTLCNHVPKLTTRGF